MNLLLSSSNTVNTKSLNGTPVSENTAVTTDDPEQVSQLSFQKVAEMLAEGEAAVGFPLQSKDVQVAVEVPEVSSADAEALLVDTALNEEALEVVQGLVNDDLETEELVDVALVGTQANIASIVVQQDLDKGDNPIDADNALIPVAKSVKALLSESSEGVAEEIGLENSDTDASTLAPKRMQESLSVSTQAKDNPGLAAAVKAQMSDETIGLQSAKDSVKTGSSLDVKGFGLSSSNTSLSPADSSELVNSAPKSSDLSFKELSKMSGSAGNEPVGLSENLLKSSKSPGLSELSPDVMSAAKDELVTDAKSASFSRELNSATALNNSSRVQLPVNVNFSKPEWSGVVAERTALMFAQNINTAELQLDPPEIGPLQVKVSVNQDQASVVFTASNQMVRESVDQSIFRLRELLSQQGLDLVNVDISHQQQQSQEQQYSGEGKGEAAMDDAEYEDLESHCFPN